MGQYPEMSWQQYFEDLRKEPKEERDEYYRDLFNATFKPHIKKDIINGNDYSRFSVFQDSVNEMNRPN